MKMGHVLVVGGTGMLADVSKWHAKSYHKVSIVARDKLKMQKIERESSFYSPFLKIKVCVYKNIYERSSILIDFCECFLIERKKTGVSAATHPLELKPPLVEDDSYTKRNFLLHQM
ncbi:hypothetical protein ACFCVU_16895 [Peribacillus butanolivorans]|uniref:hypothetical protein n=1 Tax=Peribacillus butanolivorans TaxID=421767 RepID=UPI00167FD5D4|nr:hypothetical protein GM240_22175 [Peribacillus butanolivorans]